MSLYDNFTKLKEMARTDAALRERLLTAGREHNPISNFCRIAREEGCEMYPMDIVATGEEYYAAMKRSTNGGGENSHMLTGWDNYFDLLLREIEELE